MAGKRILFTGGSGKAGRHVVPYLLDRGHRVVNVDLTPLAQPGVDNLTADITNSGQMFDVMTSYGNLGELDAGTGTPRFDAVVHFAAIPRILIRPDNETFRVNTLGTYNVIEAAVKLGIRKIVIASSETTYGICFSDGQTDPRSLPLEEDYDVDPMDSYGLSKVLNEVTARSFQRRSGFDIYALRIGNVVEPHEYAELLPGLLRQPGGAAPQRLLLHRRPRPRPDRRPLPRHRRPRLPGVQRRQRHQRHEHPHRRARRPLLPRRADDPARWARTRRCSRTARSARCSASARSTTGESTCPGRLCTHKPRAEGTHNDRPPDCLRQLCANSGRPVDVCGHDEPVAPSESDCRESTRPFLPSARLRDRWFRVAHEDGVRRRTNPHRAAERARVASGRSASLGEAWPTFSLRKGNRRARVGRP